MKRDILAPLDESRILFMVWAMNGASGCLSNGVIFYYDSSNKISCDESFYRIPIFQCYENLKIIDGDVANYITDLAKKRKDLFTFLAGGLGNFAYVNRGAVYLGRNDDNHTIKLRFNGEEFELHGYLPTVEFPFIEEGDELLLKEYDRKKF